MKRYGRAVKIKEGRREEYVRLHASVWPEVSGALRAAKIRNYTLFERGGLVFSYFEYVGDDYEGDRSRLLADPAMARWNELTLPCLEGVSAGAELFAPMDVIFHAD